MGILSDLKTLLETATSLEGRIDWREALREHGLRRGYS